ncbi:hypothetical protein ACWGPW_29035 [Paenibacillus chitinolyticus]
MIDPITVDEGDYTTYGQLLIFTLTLHADSLIDRMELDSITLADDFADMQIAQIRYEPGEKLILLTLYGKVIRNAKKGTITVKGEELKKGNDLTVEVPERSAN